MDKPYLIKHYLTLGESVAHIAHSCGVSENKVHYWMAKYGIRKRSISEALSMKKHGPGGGFTIKSQRTPSEEALYGLGVGLYWGEGNKRNKHTVRLGNTDPGILNSFAEFLVCICGVDRKSMRYSLQIFTDTSESDALSYWCDALSIHKSQIMPTVNHINSGKIGTYKMKNQFGVMTLYVFNMKLRNWLVDQLHVPR